MFKWWNNSEWKFSNNWLWIKMAWYYRKYYVWSYDKWYRIIKFRLQKNTGWY